MPKKQEPVQATKIPPPLTPPAPTKSEEVSARPATPPTASLPRPITPPVLSAAPEAKGSQVKSHVSLEKSDVQEGIWTGKGPWQVTVHIAEAVEFSGSSKTIKAYCVVQLSGHKKQTDELKVNERAVWNSEFQFTLTDATQPLQITVYEKKLFGDSKVIPERKKSKEG
tara:strand:+ start:432 stop:935 length:504 start_codon:yes stop_codon:yes gene_type:complete